VTSAAQQFSVDLLDLATSSITVKARATTNNYGEPTYAGVGTSFSAYVEKVTKSGRSVEGDEKLIEYRAYIPSTTYTPAISDQVTTADGLTRPVVEVDVRSDEFGQQVVVLALGAARRF
jgi:hypothetical protein